MRARWAVGEIGRLCHELGGAVRTSELRACGVDARSVRRATVSGEVIRIRSGLYASPDLPWPTKVALRHGGVLACVSVARRLGLWVLPLDELVHVSLPANGHALVHSDCGCVQHWNALPVSSIEVTLVDALLQIRGCLGEDAFFVTLESALHLGLLDGPSRGELRARITESARWMVDFARNDAESGLESLLRIRLHRLGLRLRTQVEIPGVGRVDFVLGDRLILEVDGRAGHDGPDGRHRDRLRDAVAAGHGFHTLRFDYELVVDDWPLVEQAILETIRRRAHLDPWAEQLRSA